MRSSVFDSCQSVSHLTLLVLAIINICYYCCSINLSLSESNGPNHSGNRRGYREFDFFKTNNEEKIKIWNPSSRPILFSHRIESNVHETGVVCAWICAHNCVSVWVSCVSFAIVWKMNCHWNSTNMCDFCQPNCAAELKWKQKWKFNFRLIVAFHSKISSMLRIAGELGRWK